MASAPKVNLNGISLVGALVVVLYARRTFGNSSTHVPFTRCRWSRVRLVRQGSGISASFLPLLCSLPSLGQSPAGNLLGQSHLLLPTLSLFLNLLAGHHIPLGNCNLTVYFMTSPSSDVRTILRPPDFLVVDLSVCTIHLFLGGFSSSSKRVNSAMKSASI